ncbi:MAG: glycosyltransferase family 9 protein [Nitrospirota bacterium]|nr:glycosyltransferase family 9 protein [Nitrospirota bacterium]
MARAIVMIHPGGLGDVFLAVPAMTRLRIRFPNHRLLLCAGDQVATLLQACMIIDDWTSVQGRACADLFAGSVTGQLQTWLEDCDLAIGWMEDADGRLSGALKAAGVREVIVRSPFSLMIHATHQRDRFLEAINEIPYGGEGYAGLTVAEPLLSLGQACLDAAGLSSVQPFAVIHPGSGSAHKCVGPEILASVVAALQHSGTIPVILEGPADRAPVERLLQACLQPPVVLKGLDVLTVAVVLAHARFFLGQDSGVTHMAGLLGVRTVALFGPTEPARWAPRGAHVTIVQGQPCLCRSWGDVSRCEEQPCLRISQKDLVSLCLAQLREAAV